MRKALLRGGTALSIAVLINASLAIGMAAWADLGRPPREKKPSRPSSEIPFVKTSPPKKKTPTKKTSVRQMAATPAALPALSIPSSIVVPVFVAETIEAVSVVHPVSEGDKPVIDKETILTEDMVDDPPKPILRTPLRYPKEAESKGIEGEVEARLLLDADGSVLKVRIVSAKPPGYFESAAKEALLTWRFTPARFRGQQLKAWVRQRVAFKLH